MSSLFIAITLIQIKLKYYSGKLNIYLPMYSLSFQIEDILAIHQKSCPSFTERKIQLSCDGMSESRSSSVSVDVYSLKMKNCQCIYPHKLVRPLGKNVIDHRKQLKDVVCDILANDLRIMQFIADNLKRAIAKECKNHAAWYPCEYCYAKGIKIDLNENNNARKKILDQIKSVNEKISQCQNEPLSQSKIENLIALKEELQKSLSALRRKSNILWPQSTMYSEHRSRQTIDMIIEKLKRNEELSIDEAKGFVGISVFLDVPDFNFVYDSPCEYMHCACLGVVKRLLMLTFDVGENRSRVTKRKLSSVKAFNNA